ncbi:MAG: LuxR C-terminal-related transcriptional regulator [Thiotrichales bacterium]|nr:LuxR C-terminal-related transcriptional regulator [Thiotrichales bacterium]
MNRHDQFEQVLASLHEAALDDCLWPGTSALIDEVCGATSNCLAAGDGAAQDDIEIFFTRFCYRGQRYEQLERMYFESYFALDERIPRVRQLPDRQLVHVSSLYTDEEKKTSPAYNEALLLSDGHDSLNVRLDGPHGTNVAWQIGGPVDADGWSSARVETIERLLPHLRQFVRVRQTLVDAQALGASFSALLENTRCGVIQLDLRGRIVTANDRALNFLRKRDGLYDERGRLHAACPREDVALQGLLTRAVPPFGSQGASGSMMVTRPVAAPRLVVHVNPVGEAWTGLRSVRAAALVLTVDPAERTRIDSDLVATVLGLTPAESGVAVMLAQGSTIRDIALTTSRSQNTIRWHVKHIFVKLNISRQLELVQLVQSIADLSEARRADYRQSPGG